MKLPQYGKELYFSSRNLAILMIQKGHVQRGDALLLKGSLQKFGKLSRETPR